MTERFAVSPNDCGMCAFCERKLPRIVFAESRTISCSAPL
jgi:hypothetical protein